ncbi:MAG: NAD-dependent epimerase/dehydratase family protein [Planctomycetota bacterium]
MPAIGRLLVAGCGDLGTRVGLLAASRGATVFGVKREPSGLPEPIVGIRGDLALGAFEVPSDLDAVVLSVAPNRARDDASDRVRLYERTYLESARGLLRALRAAGSTPRRLVFTSSTSVYGEDGGEDVDEGTPAVPREATGRVLLATEELLRASGFATTALRCAGIYGPGRTRLVEQVLNGDANYGIAPPRTTNRIHVDDAAGAVVHVLEMDEPDDLYVVVDEEPAPEGEVLTWLARRLGAEPPRALKGPSPHGAGKRCSSAKLRASGFVLAYPSFREGYEQVIATLGDGPFAARGR